MTPELSQFKGQWALSREIFHDDGAKAVFEGHAVWAEGQGGYLYREEGALHIAGHGPVTAERNYIWRVATAGGIDVCFDDGRPFHHIGVQATGDRHWCDPDTYVVEYDFSDWPKWRSEWAVTGPRKNYRMSSFYTR